MVFVFRIIVTVAGVVFFFGGGLFGWQAVFDSNIDKNSSADNNNNNNNKEQQHVGVIVKKSRLSVTC